MDRKQVDSILIIQLAGKQLDTLSQANSWEINQTFLVVSVNIASLQPHELQSRHFMNHLREHCEIFFSGPLLWFRAEIVFSGTSIFLENGPKNAKRSKQFSMKESTTRYVILLGYFLVRSTSNFWNVDVHVPFQAQVWSAMRYRLF